MSVSNSVQTLRHLLFKSSREVRLGMSKCRKQREGQEGTGREEVKLIEQGN